VAELRGGPKSSERVLELLDRIKEECMELLDEERPGRE
jgi:hypothetical protein